MGTKRYSETPLPGYYIMRDLNEDSSLSSWPLFYGDKTVTNGYYCNGAMSGSTIDGYLSEDKYALKQKIVEHEAVFKNQVCELHRLYRIQRDMMEQVQKKELHKERASMEPLCSSNIHGSQPEENARKKWHMAGFPLQDIGHNRTSILGVEITDSPMSCTKQDNYPKPNWFPFKNGSTSRNCEASESRPSKVRKKLFDLQLPADEYVDVEEGEGITAQRMPKIPTCDLNENPEPFYRNCSIEKTDLTVHGQASSSRSRSFFGFADLNEPVKNDEAAFDFLGKGENKGAHNKPTRSNADYIGVNDATLNGRGGFLPKLHTETKVSEKGWLSHINEAGSSKNSIDSLSQSRHLCKLPPSSPTAQASPSHLHHGPEQNQTGNGTRDFRTDIRRHGLKSVERNNVLSYGNNLKPIAHRPPGSYSLFSTPSCNSSWAQSVPALEKSDGAVQQMNNAFDSSLLSSSKHLLPHSQNQEMKWQQVKANPRLNDGYHESWSVFQGREYLPLACFDYLICNGNHNVASDQLTNHASGKNFGGSSCAASKPGNGIDINSKAVFAKDHNAMTENKDRPSPLPWLKPEPISRTTEAGESRRLEFSGESSYFHAWSKHSCCKNERVGDLNQPGSSDCEIFTKNDKARSDQKIMGAPIFGTVVQEIEPSTNICTSTKSTNIERKNIKIDINLECEPDEPISAEEPIPEKGNQKKNRASIRDYIDLNSCVSDFENPPSNRENKCTKTRIMIDLEAPASMESEDEDDSSSPEENEPDKVSIQGTEDKKDVQTQNEVLKNAAQIMITISSSYPQSHAADTLLDNPLLLFADAIESMVRDESLHPDSSNEIDSFEAMTLQLKETKEEDYMPRKPFTTNPQPEKVEEAEIAKLPNRPRRGQGRRGRQRKDFQRDILPGMASLSRHEVNEDIQTFGGLMKATGHHWHSRLTRKNGGARGRSRGSTVVVRNPICTRSMQQQISNGDACLEEKRSLTGWGKTTRRPRRQRCQMGNHPTVLLT